ncbi:hypothetical protein H112_05541, partial [Trichophyton rubrum D6]
EVSQQGKKITTPFLGGMKVEEGPAMDHAAVANRSIVKSNNASQESEGGLFDRRSTQQDSARGFRSTKEGTLSHPRRIFTYARTRLAAESCKYKSTGVDQIWGVDGRITESWGSQRCLKSESRAAAYNDLDMDTSKRRR